MEHFDYESLSCVIRKFQNNFFFVSVDGNAKKHQILLKSQKKRVIC